MNITLIVCQDNKHGIGFNGRIPWKEPKDLARFKRITEDGILIVGRATAETLPNLPGRTIYVLTRSAYTKRGAKIFSDLDTALKEAKKHQKNIFFAGGSDIYRQVLKSNLAEILDITTLKSSHNCDTFFPEKLIGCEWECFFSLEDDTRIVRIFKKPDAISKI